MVRPRLLLHALTAVALLVLCSAVAVQVGAVEAQDADGDDFELSVVGEASATEQNGQHFAWAGQDDALEIAVFEYQFPGNDSSSAVELCLESAAQDAGWSDRGCTDEQIDADSTAPPVLNRSLRLDDRFDTGELQLRISLGVRECDTACDEECDGDCGTDCETDCDAACDADCDAEQFASRTTAVTLLDPDGDLDDDGLANDAEVAHGTDLTEPDTDGDDLEDGPEVEQYETDPVDDDSDGDGLDDAAEVDRWDSQPTVADTDGDGLDDRAEIEDHGSDPTDPHSDDDGLDDGSEVDEYGTNPTKTDTDGDGIGDGIEVDRGTDPTDPNDLDDGNQSATEEPTDPSPAGSTGSASEADVQRGFFSNGEDSSGTSLFSETDLTVLGFLLSLLSVIVPMVTEG